MNSCKLSFGTYSQTAAKSVNTIVTGEGTGKYLLPKEKY